MILRQELIGICLVVMWTLTLAVGVFVTLEDTTNHPVALSEFSARQRY